ncbi:hypothetical protein HDU87_006669 [Geranomyces variabilis]|uniref:Uncharacterized protein n=1 Tax=Geranomyces variabilis TaxID=109894 RepID=A0AAD5TF17_9FUNG|nr:hypothetical protein HDU87_006669 [Geranomyces variabilis]
MRPRTGNGTHQAAGNSRQPQPPQPLSVHDPLVLLRRRASWIPKADFLSAERIVAFIGDDQRQVKCILCEDFILAQYLVPHLHEAHAQRGKEVIEAGDSVCLACKCLPCVNLARFQQAKDHIPHCDTAWDKKEIGMSIFEMLVPEGKGNSKADELHPCIVAGTKRPSTDVANDTHNKVLEKSRRTSASTDAKDTENISVNETTSMDSSVYDNDCFDTYAPTMLSESMSDEPAARTAAPDFFEGPLAGPVSSLVAPTLSSTFAEHFERTSSWLSPKPFHNSERLSAPTSYVADLPRTSAAAAGFPMSIAAPLTPALAATIPNIAYPTPTYALGPAENSIQEHVPLGQLLPPFYYDPSAVMIPPPTCFPTSECPPPAGVKLPVPANNGDFEVSVLHVTVPRRPKPQHSAHTSPLATTDEIKSLTVPVPVLSHMPVSAVKKFVWHYLSLSQLAATRLNPTLPAGDDSTGNLQLWHWEGAQPQYLEDDQLIGQWAVHRD